MNYTLTILLILFLKLYSIQNYDKKLYGVWNLIISKEYYSRNTNEEYNKIATYKIGEKVIEFKANGTIINYQENNFLTFGSFNNYISINFYSP